MAEIKTKLHLGATFVRTIPSGIRFPRQQLKTVLIRIRDRDRDRDSVRVRVGVRA